MTIPIEELFKYSYVITIDQQKLDLFKKVFSYHRLPVPKEWRGIQLANVRPDSFCGIDKLDMNSIPLKYIQCACSHISLVRMAKELDWPFICIFEDDAYPCIDIGNKLEYYLTDIPDNCSAMFLGNCEIFGDYEPGKKYFSVQTARGAHAYIIFRQGYDRYINAYETWTFVADRIFEKVPNVLSPEKNLFIQYNIHNTMTSSRKYEWGYRTEEQILAEFPRIEDILK